MGKVSYDNNIKEDSIWENLNNVLGKPPMVVPSGPPPEGVVRVVYLPTACATLMFHLMGYDTEGNGGRHVFETVGRIKLMRYLYGFKGKVSWLSSLAKYNFAKKAVIATIPEEGYRNGYVFIQFVPLVGVAGFSDATIVTRIILVTYDVVPSERRVAEAVAATLAFMARRYGAGAIGEAMNIRVLRPALGSEEGVPTIYITKFKRQVKARVWSLRNLPPLPKVEYIRLPPRHKLVSGHKRIGRKPKKAREGEGT